MAAPKIDERGFIAESDREARQRLIDERARLVRMAAATQHMLDEYDRLIGGARYPYADSAFDRTFANLARSAFAVFNVDELHEMGVAYDPDWCEPETPIRAGLCA